MKVVANHQGTLETSRRAIKNNSRQMPTFSAGGPKTVSRILYSSVLLIILFAAETKAMDVGEQEAPTLSPNISLPSLDNVNAAETETSSPETTSSATLSDSESALATDPSLRDESQPLRSLGTNASSTMMRGQPCDHVPRSDRQQILDSFNKFFVKPRAHEDQQQKEFVRQGVIGRLKELGFETSFLQKTRFELQRRPAISYNIVSILPGKHRRTEHERILLIGAHWDSVSMAPGVDDNGSGSVCLLEIARLISENRCAFNYTIMFVWFDYEEQGKLGSEFFVNDYLFPYELEKFGSKFVGAYIMDMILARDKENNTQTMPAGLLARLPEFASELDSDKYRADFLTAWARRTWDEPLEGAFRDSWIQLGNEGRTFKAMRPALPQWRVPSSEERSDWKDFYRSDHASFWFPAGSTTTATATATARAAPSNQARRRSTIRRPSLNAVLLTDLGPWRRSYRHCYHSACDDKHLLTDSNLAFMQQVVDSLLLTLVRLGQGSCAKVAHRSRHQLSPPAKAGLSGLEAESTTRTTTPTPTTTTTTTTTIAPSVV